MQALTFILAFVAVLALIAALAWGGRRFAGNRLRAIPARDQARAAVGSTELPPRIAPLPDAGNWNDGDGSRADPFDHAEPAMPEPPPRPQRPSFVDEVRRPAPPPLQERAQERAQERRSDPLLSG